MGSIFGFLPGNEWDPGFHLVLYLAFYLVLDDAGIPGFSLGFLPGKNWFSTWFSAGNGKTWFSPGVLPGKIGEKTRWKLGKIPSFAGC